MARFLVTADVHLMRESSGCPGHGSERTWHSVCQHAKDRDCDAILVAGDLLDSAVAYSAALRVVREGAKKFGGPIVMVSGNHDAYHLPHLVQRLGDDHQIRLLGPNGTWEVTEINGVGIAGWSFPVTSNGRAGREQAFQNGGPPGAEIAILHADVGSSSETYHPVSPQRFEEHPQIGTWFLGHVHSPAASGTRWRYCGSPQALDFGETGDHGAWIHDTATGECEFVETSTVRYRRISVDLTGVPDLDELSTRIANTLDDHAKDFNGELRCRVTLKGETRLTPAELAKIKLDDEKCEAIEVGRITPPLDLENLAKETGSVRGRLAKLIRDLDSDEPVPPHLELLVIDAQTKIESRLGEDGHVPTTLDPRERVRSVAARLLQNVTA